MNTRRNYRRSILYALFVGVYLLLGGSGTASAISANDLYSINSNTPFFDPTAAGACDESGDVSLTGSDNEQKAFNYFKDQEGLSDVQAAAIVGNLMGESGLNPADGEGNGIAEGIAQWGGGRLQNLKNMSNPYTLQTQLQFVSQELHQSYPDVLSNLKQQTDITEAVGYFMGTSSIMQGYLQGDPTEAQYTQVAQADLADGSLQKFVSEHGPVGGYENPGAPDMVTRLNDAKAIYQKYGNGSVSGVTAGCSGGGSVDCSTGATIGSLSQLQQSVVCEAQAELSLWTSGQLVPGTDFTKYTPGHVQQLWCADFISWLYTQAGDKVNEAAAFGFESEPGFTYHTESGYTPQPGDVVVYSVSHVNLVVSVNTSDHTMVVIGGDQGGGDGVPYYNYSRVSEYTGITDEVGADTGSWGLGTIEGFASPDEQ